MNQQTNTAKPYSWRDHPELMARLNAAQNSDRYANVDITTFAGWAGSEAALIAHVERCEAKAAVAA